MINKAATNSENNYKNLLTESARELGMVAAKSAVVTGYLTGLALAGVGAVHAVRHSAPLLSKVCDPIAFVLTGPIRCPSAVAQHPFTCLFLATLGLGVYSLPVVLPAAAGAFPGLALSTACMHAADRLKHESLDLV